MVAILGVLAKIGFSGYVSYVQRSNREMAKTVLRQNVSRMERYYSQNGRYLTSSDAWPSNYIESKLVSTGGTVYTISFAPSAITSGNAATYRQSFNILATPISGTIQATDSAGRMCITQLGIITENAPDNCGILSGPNPSLCTGTMPPPPPAVVNCANQDCSGGTVCGACSGGNAGWPYNYGSGSCASAYIGGSCAGLCNNSIIKGACTGNCSNSVVCGACSGTCTGVTKTGC